MVTVPRYFADDIVTEYGIVSLMGRDVREWYYILFTFFLQSLVIFLLILRVEWADIRPGWREPFSVGEREYI